MDEKTMFPDPIESMAPGQLSAALAAVIDDLKEDFGEETLVTHLHVMNCIATNEYISEDLMTALSFLGPHCACSMYSSPAHMAEAANRYDIIPRLLIAYALGYAFGADL